MKKTVILIPCYNEGLTIGKVVSELRKELPEADIYVYDNNSTDGTADAAAAAGAIVRKETLQGKGCVVRSMFRDIEADIYVMVDGDDTYQINKVRTLIDPVAKGDADMVVGDRLSDGSYYKENTRHFHNFGNNLVTRFINFFFHTSLTDIMSGYRVFSRRFVKTFPVLNDGFQLETEMTIFALNYKLHVVEIPVSFSERPEGSVSKLNTFSDGFKVLLCIMNMYRHYKPFRFFLSLSVISLILGLAVGAAPVIEFIQTRYVSRVPSAILACGLVIVAMLLLVCGFILDTVEKNSRLSAEYEIKKFPRQ